MPTIQLTVIVALVLSLMTGIGVHRYDANKYAAKSESVALAQAAQLSAANQKALAAERKYNDLNDQNQRAILARAASTVAAADSLSTVVNTRGLWVRAVCTAAATKLPVAANAASAPVIAGTDVRLSDEAANFFSAEARRADDAADYAAAAHDYAVTMQKFIEEQKSTTSTKTR